MKPSSPFTKRLIILDSLRGLAAFIVLFHHFFKINNNYLKKILNKDIYEIFSFISSLNHESVIFFFLLSGFSIGLSLKSDNLISSTTLNNYIYRRLKRILPIYIFSLIITLFCGLLTNKLYSSDYSLYNLMGNLLFLQTSDSIKDSWFTPYGFNGSLWSLAFEFFFYWFFIVLYSINFKFLYKFSTITKFILLLGLVICCIIINKYIFIPYLLFFTSFPIWILGYLTSRYFLFKKSYDSLFILSILFGLIYIVIGTRYFQSNTLIVVSKGLIMNFLFYFITKLSYSKINTQNFFICKALKQGLNFLFYRIGLGSYALYAFHYPILLLLNFYNLSILPQLIIMTFLITFCIILEEFSLKIKFDFLKIDYLTPTYRMLRIFR